MTGLFLSLLIYQSIEDQYKTSVVISPGTVGVIKISANEKTASSVEVEQASLVIENLNRPEFYSNKIIQACGAGDGKNNAKDIIRSLKTYQIPRSNQISLTVFRPTAQLSHDCMQSIIEKLSFDTEEKARAQFKNSEDLLNEYGVYINTEKKFAENYKKIHERYKKNSLANSYEYEVFALKINHEISKNERLYKKLEAYLLPPLTRNVTLESEMVSESKPLKMSKVNYVLLGISTGLLAGLFLISFLRSKNKIKQNSMRAQK